MNAPPPYRPVLCRFRRPWMAHLQLAAMFCLTLQPLTSPGYWTDTNADGAREWVENPPPEDSWWDQDSDGDSMTNAEEVLFGSDPYSIDSDADGLADKDERDFSATNPWNWDSDADGFSDYDGYYQQLQSIPPAIHYLSLVSAGQSFYSYFDADGDGIHNPFDSDPLGFDRDGDGLVNWQDSYIDDPYNGTRPPADAVGFHYNGTWYAGIWSDADSDGIPDPADFFPHGSYTWHGFEYAGSWTDSDSDGIPDPADYFPNGSYVWNGYEYEGTWVDTDGDGVPDPADAFPNGSFWWNGQEYDGSALDTDGDDVPDVADPFPFVQASFWWHGNQYPGDYMDTDYDGIPDQADPFPAGSYWYGEIEYGGIWTDTDGDGIPNSADPFPQGSFWRDGVEYDGLSQEGSTAAGSSGGSGASDGYLYDGHWYSGLWSDLDGDAIPDPADPFPNGSYWFEDVQYGGSWTDTDLDGLPDPADPFPNGSYFWNEVEYPGVFVDDDRDGLPDEHDLFPGDSLNGKSPPPVGYYYNSILYEVLWFDDDADGIPDPADPYPTIAGSFMWRRTLYPGSYSDFDADKVPDAADAYPEDPMDGMRGYFYSGKFYPGEWVDTDRDSIPDVLDPFPRGSYWWLDTEYALPRVDTDRDGIPDRFDPFPNGSFTWNGQEYPLPDVDSDGDTVPDAADPYPYVAGSFWYENKEYPGCLEDNDLDGDKIPDQADLFPWEYSFSWYGRQFIMANTDADHDQIPDFADPYPNPGDGFWWKGVEYPGPWVDTDNDKTPDRFDNWPGDPYNNADSDGDGLSDYVEEFTHHTQVKNVDSDGDWLTDYEELLIFHTDPLAAKTDPNQAFVDFYVVAGIDTDQDGIPDHVEKWYRIQGRGMNETDPLDAAGDLDGDGISNLVAYKNGWSFIAALATYDYDDDGITDVCEDHWSLLYPGSLDKTIFEDSVRDFDNDSVLNFEEVQFHLNIANPTTHPGVADLDYINQQHSQEWKSSLLPKDMDGDGMPDLWEHRHHFDVRSAANAILDPDGDTLPNLQEYQSWRNPLVCDYSIKALDAPSLLIDPGANSQINKPYQPVMAQALPEGTAGNFKMTAFSLDEGAGGGDPIFEVWNGRWKSSSGMPERQFQRGTTAFASSDKRAVCEPATAVPSGSWDMCACQHGTNDRFIGHTESGVNAYYAGKMVVDYTPEEQECIPRDDIYYEPFAVTSWGAGPSSCPAEGIEPTVGGAFIRMRLNSNLSSNADPVIRRFEITRVGDDIRNPPTEIYYLSINPGDRYSSVLGGEAPPGGTITVSYAPENPRSSDDSPASGISAADGSGSRYRKVGLNGVPIPDSKPQVQSENGEGCEETYIDAFLAQLRHAVSDVYVTDPGSLIPLMVRRDASPDSWNERNGLLPAERPTHPFGPGWSSNICSYIRFDGENRALVVDEMGSRQQFIFVNGFWMHDRQESGDLKTRLNRFSAGAAGSVIVYTGFDAVSVRTYSGLQLNKKFGTTCYYEMVSPKSLVQVYHSDRKTKQGITVTTYARLKKVTDRWGDELMYEYPDSSLIPKRIYDPKRPGHEITVEQKDGYVVQVRGPGGDTTRYEYDDGQSNPMDLTDTTVPPPPMLVAVWKGDSVVRYSYEQAMEEEVDSQISALRWKHFHRELAGITDERGNSYRFQYRPNLTIFEMTPEGEKRRQFGLPRILTTVTSPTGGRVRIDHERVIDPSISYFGAARPVVTQFTSGPRGDERTYRYTFTDPIAVKPSGPLLATDNPNNIQITYSFTKMTIAAPDPVTGLVGPATEQYTFDSNANFALKNVKDRNGLETKFEYLDQGPGYLQAFDDPTKETNADGREKRFSYDAATRMLKTITDFRGVKTEYEIDAATNGVAPFGRRKAETVIGTTVIPGGRRETYEYTHPTFAGFMTKKTLSVNPAASNNPGTAVFQPITITYATASESAQTVGWWRMITETSTVGGASSHVLTIHDFNGNKRSVTDGRNNTTLFAYDGGNRLINVTYPDGASRTLGYDAHGNLTKEVNETGTATFHSYDAFNRRTTTVVDLNGNGIADGRYTAITVDSKGMPVYDGDLVTETEYNDFNLPIRLIDARGIVTEHEYDKLGRRTKTTVNANGGTAAERAITRFEYRVVGVNGGMEAGGSVFDSSSFQPVRITDALNRVTSFAYDKLYRVVSETRPDGNVVHKTYDQTGNVTSVTEPTAPATTLYYVVDPQGNSVFKRSTTTKPYATWSSYDALGAVSQTTFVGDKKVQNFYTPHGKVWKSIDEVGAVTQTFFDGAGLPFKVQLEKPSTDVSASSPVTLTSYDAAGNAVTVTNPNGHTTRTVYDYRNRAIQVISPPVVDGSQITAAQPSPAPVQAVTTTEYDAAGRVIRVTDPLGLETRNFYDLAGRLVHTFDALDHPTVMTYDAAGNVLTTTNALEQTVTNSYDAFGRLVTTTDHGGIVNLFEYDLVGNRTAITDGAGNRTTFVYDSLNRLKEQKFANLDKWTYTYDAVDKISQTDPAAKIIDFVYDNRHRLTQEKNGTAVRTRTYVDGRLTKITEPGLPASGTVEYSYDKLGRVVTEKSWGKAHAYGYDNAGNATSRALDIYGSTKKLIATTFDALNRPIAVADNNATSSSALDDKLTKYGYDRAGRPVLMIAANGQLTRNTYDRGGRLITRRLYRSLGEETDAGLLAGFAWVYDAVGNVTSQTETWMASGTQPARSRVTVMTYDDANRLASETINDGSSPAVVTTYGYDKANNRTCKTTAGGTDPSAVGMWTYVYNSANQLTRMEKRAAPGGATAEAATYTYDASGNRKARVIDGTATLAARTTSYTWDVWGRLISVAAPVVSGTTTTTQTHSYAYDYRMRRTGVQRTAVAAIGQDARHTAFVFSGGLSVAEYDRSTNTGLTSTTLPTVQHVRGKDMGGGVGGMLYSLRNPVGATGYPVAPTTSAPVVQRYSLSNGRGDIVAQSDPSGALTWTASYEAYGKRTKETGANKDRQRANTKDEDPTGLLNEGFRYRDLETGVWLSRDPAGFVDGPNLYAYVKQNPWTSFDPDGLATTIDSAEKMQVDPQPNLRTLNPAEFSKRAIVDEEVGGGEASYNRQYSRPIWPGGRSGVTIGVGYDLGMNTRVQIERDWSDQLGLNHVRRLQEVAGKTGSNAKGKENGMRDILVPFSSARTVFENNTIPRFSKETETAFPGVNDLHPLCQGALLSLVFNRGPGMTGNRRTEMRAIRDALRDNKPEKVPQLLRDMKRLWDGQGLGGLIKRRENEAAMFETGLWMQQLNRGEKPNP